MYFVRYDGVVTVIEDVEEPAVSSQRHVEIRAANIGGCRVEQRDWSFTVDSVGRECVTVSVVGVGKLTIASYDEPACCQLSVRDGRAQYG